MVRARRRVLWIGLVMLLAACAGVLGLKRSKPERFAHKAHVIAGVSCTRCHGNVEQGSGLHIPQDATCVACHTKPHDSRPCSGCHVSEKAIAEVIQAREHLIFDHAGHIGRLKGNCMRCHDRVVEGEGPVRPPMATCFRCHGDTRDARQCDACHKNLETEGTLPASHLAHEGDWLREHGTRASSSGDLCATCHSQSYCAKCHGQTAPTVPWRQNFADPMRASVHRAGFASRHALEARSDPGACTVCHAPSRCAACHDAKGLAGDGARNPHPPGWVGIVASENRHGREARRDPASCAACHGGAGEKMCASCHSVGGVGGNPHPPGFSSKLPMSALPCRLCHPIGAR